jgi:hypothetical protein
MPPRPHVAALRPLSAASRRQWRPARSSHTPQWCDFAQIRYDSVLPYRGKSVTKRTFPVRSQRLRLVGRLRGEDDLAGVGAVAPGLTGRFFDLCAICGVMAPETAPRVSLLSRWAIWWAIAARREPRDTANPKMILITHNSTHSADGAASRALPIARPLGRVGPGGRLVRASRCTGGTAGGAG